MKPNQFLAHPDQSLVAHLIGVARRAHVFAAHFQGKDHAKLAGLLHDLGKADESFRKRMEVIAAGKPDPGGKNPHAPHGAALALANLLGSVAFATASERDAKMRAVEFYTQMLFSALVDADRLDTEESNPATGSKANVINRKAWRFGPECLARSGNSESLLGMLDAAIQERVAKARSENASDAVLDVRAPANCSTCSRRKPNSLLYHSGLNEPGLDVKCEALGDPANYVL